MIRPALAAAVLAWAGAAAADLYRWVDPETGSVKFSNYPPPWYGDPARERRSPKVEVIPDRGAAKPEPKAEEEARPEPKPKAAAKPVDISPDKPAASPEPDPLKQKRADDR